MAVGAHKSVRIVLGRQGQYLDIQAFLEQHVNSTNRSFYTRLVTIKHLGYIVRKTANGMDVPLGKRSARRCDDILETGLVHRDDIGITLHNEAFFLFADFSFCLIESINDISLGID